MPLGLLQVRKYGLPLVRLVYDSYTLAKTGVLCTTRFTAAWVADVYAGTYGRKTGYMQLTGSPQGVITPQ